MFTTKYHGLKRRPTLNLVDTTSNLEVVHFLRSEVAHNVVSSDFLLLDNAGVYSTVDVRTALNDVMLGNWDYKSEYSYDLSACERGLSAVTSFIRARSHACTSRQHVIDLIDHAFWTYSTKGPSGKEARNHFIHYQRNHERFLRGEV